MCCVCCNSYLVPKALVRIIKYYHSINMGKISQMGGLFVFVFCFFFKHTPVKWMDLDRALGFVFYQTRTLSLL